MHAKMGINFSLDLVRLFCSQFKTIFAKIKTGKRFFYIILLCYHICALYFVLNLVRTCTVCVTFPTVYKTRSNWNTVTPFHSAAEYDDEVAYSVLIQKFYFLKMEVFIIEMNFYGIESWMERMTEQHFRSISPQYVWYIHLHVHI